MKAYRSSIAYGDAIIPYSFSFVDRKTMEIAVHPDSKVVVKAPKGTSTAAIEARVAKRARWIKKQINYFQGFVPRTPPRSYVGGETHLYLGRHYRLKIKKDREIGVKLKGRFIHITTPEPKKSRLVKRLLDEWYKEHARLIYSRRLEICHKTVKSLGVPLPKIQLREMMRRWGSCTRSGGILLNTTLVKAPLYCIDYVIMHELCHLKAPTHDNGYYRLLSKYMPDWEKRKERLERVLL
jgi:predicted metal-dependent hydrolase